MKDGGKYAFLGMESREAGDAVIKALHLQVLSLIQKNYRDEQDYKKYWDIFLVLTRNMK